MTYFARRVSVRRYGDQTWISRRGGGLYRRSSPLAGGCSCRCPLCVQEVVQLNRRVNQVLAGRSRVQAVRQAEGYGVVRAVDSALQSRYFCLVVFFVLHRNHSFASCQES